MMDFTHSPYATSSVYDHHAPIWAFADRQALQAMPEEDSHITPDFHFTERIELRTASLLEIRIFQVTERYIFFGKFKIFAHHGLQDIHREIACPGR